MNDANQIIMFALDEMNIAGPILARLDIPESD